MPASNLFMRTAEAASILIFLFCFEQRRGQPLARLQASSGMEALSSLFARSRSRKARSFATPGAANSTQEFDELISAHQRPNEGSACAHPLEWYERKRSKSGP